MNRKSFPLATLMAASVVAVACLGAASAVFATSPDMSRIDDEHLERLFWDCDAYATQQALSPGDGALCATLSDVLKARRFDGDFSRMLDWWHAHKVTEHARRGVDTSPLTSTVDADEAALQAP
jgi:hypothetical protein